MYDNKPKKSKFPPIVGIIAIILIVLFGKGLFFHGSDEDVKPKETTAVTEITTETKSFIEKIGDSAGKAESKIKDKLDGIIDNDAETTASSETEKNQSVKDKKGNNKKNNDKKDSDNKAKEYKFRNAKLKDQHYEKHGKDMGFESADDYEKAASDAANSSKALHKKEKEDNDDVYYIEKTNEFVVISGDGYIRTYFNPDSGKAYYDRQ